MFFFYLSYLPLLSDIDPYSMAYTAIRSWPRIVLDWPSSLGSYFLHQRTGSSD